MTDNGGMTTEPRIRPITGADIDDIVALSADEFGAAGAARDTLELAVTGWQQLKAPVVVARSADGAFLGYARSVPNEVDPSPRPEGQVAEIAEIAVVPASRREGVGRALLARSLKTLRLLGYARVVARVTDAFAVDGWTVLPAGRGRTWIEPFIARDDLWFPSARSGSYSPLLVVPFDAARPRQAWATLRDEPPIVEAEYELGPDSRRSDAAATTAITDALAELPAAVAALPPSLLRSLIESPAASTKFRSRVDS
ncbi:hypothetical protein GCM10027029_17420 [Conyzicola lurida]